MHHCILLRFLRFSFGRDDLSAKLIVLELEVLAVRLGDDVLTLLAVQNLLEVFNLQFTEQLEIVLEIEKRSKTC